MMRTLAFLCTAAFVAGTIGAGKGPNAAIVAADATPIVVKIQRFTYNPSPVTAPVGAAVADVMVAAGLTHGGLYRHFRNKEHLVSEALFEAGEKTITIIRQLMAKSGFNAAVDGYLS